MELKIEYLDKTALKPYVNNAKIHTNGQVEQIRKSIEEFDFNDPIAVWGENEIVEGHGRLLAAMEMDDIDTVPVIRLDHLTDKQRKAYALAHNKLTMNTDFDLAILANEIAELEEEIDFTDIGFNEAELIALEIDNSPIDTEVSMAFGGSQENARSLEEENDENYSHSQAQEESSVQDTKAENYPGGLPREELDMYREKANESGLITRRVIIIYRNEEEEAYLKELFAVEPDKPLGVVYQASNMKGLKN